MRDPDQDPADIAWQATKIGFNELAGELAGGLDAWLAEGHPVATTRLIHGEQLAGERILDVRQDAEFESGHVPGSEHVELGSVPGRVAGLSREPTAVVCGHGERAMSAASLLEQSGHRDLAVLDGGVSDWVRATGGTLTTGG